jgi:hypothetical protein
MMENHTELDVSHWLTPQILDDRAYSKMNAGDA